MRVPIALQSFSESRALTSSCQHKQGSISRVNLTLASELSKAFQQQPDHPLQVQQQLLAALFSGILSIGQYH